MTTAIGLILLGGVLLFVGGEALVRGASGIALRSGLSPMVVGLTVVAFGTSCPELAVSLGAALDGHGDMAIGNVVGSNIVNIALVAALAALIKPIATDRDLIRIDGPVLIAISAAVAGFIWLGEVTRTYGLILLLFLVVYTVLRIRVARSDDQVDGGDNDTSSTWVLVALTIVGIGALAFGGSFLVDGALVFARKMGLSEAIIGLTLLALGTSLPEIATTIVASLRGSSELALGNAIGSCIYNVLAVLAATAVVSPIAVTGISPIDAAMVLATAIGLWVIIYTGRVFTRLEAGTLLTLYFGYFAWLFIR